MFKGIRRRLRREAPEPPNASSLFCAISVGRIDIAVGCGRGAALAGGPGTSGISGFLARDEKHIDRTTSKWTRPQTPCGASEASSEDVRKRVNRLG